MADLISREALLNGFDVCKVTEYDEAGFSMNYKAVSVEAIQKAPAIDPESLRQKGEWRLGKFNTGSQTVFAECSECDAVFEVPVYTLGLNYNFCPTCGADMRGENDGRTLD